MASFLHLKQRARNSRKLTLLSALIFLAFVWVVFGGRVGDNDSFGNIDQVFHPSPHITACKNGISSLIKNNVRLVAIDFDFTIIDIHTGGEWMGTSDELRPHVRSLFRCFITSCLEQGIHVSVATFSHQTDIITTVLHSSIATTKKDTSLSVDDIAVFGGQSNIPPYTKGKQSQLILAIQHANRLRPGPSKTPAITPETTVLIDDDPRNIDIARKDGYRAIQFYPENADEAEALVL